jgi:hypothetical protein
MNFMNNPVWPTLMTITIVIAAIGVGSLEAKEQGSRWIRHALVIYAIPAFVIAMLGFNYAANTYSLADFFHCRDQVCKAAAAADANQSFRIKVGLAELAALALLGSTAWVRSWFANRPDRYLPVGSNNSSGLPSGGMSNARGRASYPNPDPKKWHFNDETGEYHRITFRNGDDILYSTETYQQRSTNELKVLRDHRQLANLFWISWVLTVIFYIGFEQSSSYYASLWGFFLAISALFAILFSLVLPFSRIYVFLKSRNVGPRPIEPPGRQEVEDQNAYGNAGIAGLQDIHNALKGVGAKPRQTAQRPLFDD